MTTKAQERDSILRGIQALDGGMATEIEHLGANIDGPLWSAHVLEDAPEKVIAVHRAYIEAGAQCILTSSYQVSRMGYAEFGLAANRADAALLRSIELARGLRGVSRRRVVVAASLGPYGAALHNGAEYHGNYGCSFTDMVEFHRERIHVLAGNAPGQLAPDVLAFETLPSLDEALAIGEALAAWFCFTCKDDRHVTHGELLSECTAEVAPVSYGAKAAEWFAAGAQIVGGCCRTRPAHIQQVAEAAVRRL